MQSTASYDDLKLVDIRTFGEEKDIFVHAYVINRLRADKHATVNLFV